MNVLLVSWLTWLHWCVHTPLTKHLFCRLIHTHKLRRNAFCSRKVNFSKGAVWPNSEQCCIEKRSSCSPLTGPKTQSLKSYLVLTLALQEANPFNMSSRWATEFVWPSVKREGGALIKKISAVKGIKSEDFSFIHGLSFDLSWEFLFPISCLNKEKLKF